MVPGLDLEALQAVSVKIDHVNIEACQHLMGTLLLRDIVRHFAPDYAQDAMHHAILHSRVNVVIIAIHELSHHLN